MRVLVIEDRPDLMSEYLQVFKNMLEDSHEYTHVPTIEASIKPLFEENWDVIFIDSDLGPSAVLPEHGDESPVELCNGYDLVRYRRAAEDLADDVCRSSIVGIAANRVALSFFEDVGADLSLLKLEIPAMAKHIASIAKEKEV